MKTARERAEGVLWERLEIILHPLECEDIIDRAEEIITQAMSDARADLLRVVEAVANMDCVAFCPFCSGPRRLSWTLPSCDVGKVEHADDCAWLLARKLTGRT